MSKTTTRIVKLVFLSELPDQACSQSGTPNSDALTTLSIDIGIDGSDGADISASFLHHACSCHGELYCLLAQRPWREDIVHRCGMLPVAVMTEAWQMQVQAALTALPVLVRMRREW
jgi:hypothetical protein